MRQQQHGPTASLDPGATIQSREVPTSPPADLPSDLAFEDPKEFRRLFELANVLLCILDFDGRLKHLNPAWERLLGYPVDELLRRPFPELVHPGDAAATRDVMARLTAKSAEVVDFENRCRHQDGSHRCLAWHARSDPATQRIYAVAFDVSERDGEVAAVTVSSRNVTEEKRANDEREALIQELAAKNEELERYTYTVSHDLKSPLITIKGFLGLIENSAKSGDLSRLESDVARINGAADKMKQLLDELLELSRIGRMDNPPEDVALTALALEVVELVQRPSNRDTGSRQATCRDPFEIDVATDLPTVRGDRIRLHQVFQNLLDNAVKFMGDEADPRVEVGCRDDDGETVIYVRDNGIGIDPQFQEKVFGLFDQLDKQTQGTGIGLTLVQRIVALHGGRAWVESEGEGHGSCFCFTLSDKEA